MYVHESTKDLNFNDSNLLAHFHFMPAFKCIFVKQPQHIADCSPASSAEVKYEWSYISTPPICICGMQWDNFAFNILRTDQEESPNLKPMHRRNATIKIVFEQCNICTCKVNVTSLLSSQHHFQDAARGLWH